MTKSRVLVIDDERFNRAANRYNLTVEGYEVQVAKDGKTGLKTIRTFKPDVIITDAVLPSISGIEISRTLQSEGSTIPVIMLTAKASVDDRVAGLDAGAIDYVTKPFSTRELVARVAAQIRRSAFDQSEVTSDHSDVMQFDGFTIDLASRLLCVRGHEMSLNLREFELLVYLANNPNRVHTRDTLLSKVWGTDYTGSARTVDVHMRWLRKKVEVNPSAPRYLHTVRGVGYRFTGS